MATTPLPDVPTAQTAFDQWRDGYNRQRPHDALGLDTPIQHYQVPTPRLVFDPLPPIDYGAGTLVRIVHGAGQLQFRGHAYFITGALRGEPVGVRPTSIDGVFDCFYCHHWLGRLNAHAQTFLPAHAADEEAPMV